MSVAEGTKIGPYEILGRIGAGGMGEFYRARDTRLHRIVAIKVLHPEMAAKPDFRRRFQHEARAISTLNRHICVLHDIGRHAGRECVTAGGLSSTLAFSRWPPRQSRE